MNNYRKVGLVFLIKHMILEDKLKACFLKTKALIQQKNMIKKIYWRVAQNWEIICSKIPNSLSITEALNLLQTRAVFFYRNN